MAAAGMVTGYDRMVGFAQLVAEANGLERVGHIKEKISEMIINATLVRASLEAAIENCEVTSDGVAFPFRAVHQRRKYHGAANYSLMVRHLHDIGGGAILTAPMRADFDNEETGDLVRKYMGTMQQVDGLYRTQLFHAIRDYTADALGGWHAVTQIQAGGGLYAQRIVTRLHYDLEAAKQAALGLSRARRLRGRRQGENLVLSSGGAASRQAKRNRSSVSAHPGRMGMQQRTLIAGYHVDRPRGGSPRESRRRSAPG